MPVLYLTLVTVLNDGAIISIGYDTVKPSRHPEAWNLLVLFTVSFFLGMVVCSASLVLLWMMLDSWNPDGKWWVMK
jgi:H+-transporting ATPase